jgi:3-oxoacyl-[acyl-carrier protein] reductase
MLDFSGQLVIVTGGTRGIGRAISTAFLDRGARVIATYFGDEGAVASMQEMLGPERRARFATARFDVSDYSAAERFFQGLDRPPEVLVNNAGIRKDAIVGMMKPDDWRRVIAVNLDGSFNMSKLAVMAMLRQRYGRIVNITSVGGELALKGQANYAASKAGQTALCRALSKEVGSRNITVNCVEPGFIETEMLSDLPPELVEEYKRQVPMGRFGRAEEVAAAVLFLSSKEASYINGSTLTVSGGL